MNAQDWAARISESIGRVALTTLEFLPSILGALVLLLVGWLAARLLRAAVSRICAGLLSRLARQRLANTKAVRASTQHSRAWQSTPAVVGGIIYWTVLLFFIAAAVEALGLPAVSKVVAMVTAYLPRVLAGILIVFVGIWAGEFVRTALSGAASRAKLAYGDLAARATQVMIILVTAIIAIDQLGIDSTILVTTAATIFAATFGAAALAFGLGARSAVSNIIASRYVRRAYQTGDLVRVGEFEGHIIEITQTAVMLDGEAGRVMVPAHRFSEDTSVLLNRGEAE